MTFSGEDIQPSKLINTFTKNNVCSPASHVGGNSDLSFLPCLGNNISLLFILLSIQDPVLQARLGKQTA